MDRDALPQQFKLQPKIEPQSSLASVSKRFVFFCRRSFSFLCFLPSFLLVCFASLEECHRPRIFPWKLIVSFMSIWPLFKSEFTEEFSNRSTFSWLLTWTNLALVVLLIRTVILSRKKTVMVELLLRDLFGRISMRIPVCDDSVRVVFILCSYSCLLLDGHACDKCPRCLILPCMTVLQKISSAFGPHQTRQIVIWQFSTLSLILLFYFLFCPIFFLLSAIHPRDSVVIYDLPKWHSRERKVSLPFATRNSWSSVILETVERWEPCLSCWASGRMREAKSFYSGLCWVWFLNQPSLCLGGVIVSFRLNVSLAFFVFFLDSLRLAGVLECWTFFRRSSPGKVCLNFSSFIPLPFFFFSCSGYQWLRLDGTMSQRKRNDVVKEFNTNPNILVFLISTRAGGLLVFFLSPRSHLGFSFIALGRCWFKLDCSGCCCDLGTKLVGLLHKTSVLCSFS